MSALPGGAADKIGNRYEAWWTLLRLADVLRGDASCLRLEPLGAGGSGIEFWIDETDGRWCEQVKDASSRGSWTLHRLTTEGFLAAIVDHLADGHRIRFVASTPAKELNDLAERARAAETLQEFQEVLTDTQRKHFKDLVTTWGVATEAAWLHLKLVHVEHQPPEQLRRIVRLTYEILVQGDPDTVIKHLRGWLDDVLHQRLTGPLVWERLKEKKFARRLLPGDPTTLEALATTVDRHRRRVDSTLPTIGVAAQPYGSQLIARVADAGSKQVLVLHGRAGSGKSTIAADAAQQLASVGWFVGVVSMDGSCAACQTASALGTAAGLPASPAVALGGVANGSPAMLVIDQLDAVSLYSGRMPDGFEAVTELLDQSGAMSNLKILLVVRTVDLTADPRMRSLVSDDKRIAQMEIDDLEIDDVRALLRENAIDPTTLAGSTLQLLRVPLHLSVFSRLSQDAQRATYRTLPELYQRYTDDVRCIVERQVGHLAWADITGPLVRYMNENEQLEAPSRLLSPTSPSERRALFSHGVLVKNGTTIRFFHETYFDFLFAQAFVADQRDLHDFLADSGQFLFRRAQTRQVLEYLAATDRRAFRQTVVRILSSDTIRAHLRDVALTVLRQLDADADDWHAIEPLAFGTSAFSQRMTALLSLPAWFDAADAAGRWEELLADPATVDAAAHQMVVAARERADRVAVLVRPYVGASEQWRLRLRALVEWSLRPALVGLAVELTERGDLDDARGPIAVNSDFWSIVHSIHNDDPAGAARLMGAYLLRGIARAKADGSVDPFESQHLSDYTASGSSLIGEIATAAPAAFVDEVLPVVVRIASHTACTTDPQDLRIARRWCLRYVGSADSVDDAVFDGVDTALRLLAHDRPEHTIDLVQPLSTSDIRELRFLACRTYAAADAGDGAIAWLLSDDRNLHLGWADSWNWASRELIEAATRSCSETMLEQLALHLLAHYPDREKAIDARPYRGRTQYELLTAIDEGRRSAAVRRRIGELERKFSGFPPEPPQPIEVGWVGPPIPQNAAKFMSDEDWRRAIFKYRTGSHPSGRMLLGGCRELAGLLGSQAKEEPERFVRLALTFGPGTPGAYFSHVIRSIAEHVPAELLAELCRHARRTATQDGVDRDICFAIYTARSNVNDDLVEILKQCAISGDDPVLRAYQRSDSSEQSDCRDDLHTAGLNSTRGAAASAIAQILFASPAYADRLTLTISKLAQDRYLEVRIVAAEAVGALARHRPDAALDIAQTLFADTPIDVFNDDLTCRLLLTCILPRPSAFSQHLERALKGPESVAKRAGMVWAAAYLRDALIDPLRMKPDALATAARRGAASQLAADPSAVPDELIRLLGDEDPGVRDAAATSVRALDQVETTVARRLIAAFVSSPAFEDHFDELFRSLERSTRLLPEETIAACERAVELAGRSFGDIRTRHFATSEKIVTVVLRLYRQGGRLLRTRCLDVVDRLAEVGAYGLDKALADER